MNDKYLQYQLEDFLCDDGFINWTLKEKDADVWNVWLSKHPEALKNIEDAQNIVRNIKLKNELGASELQSSKNQIWGKIEQSTKTKEITLKPTSRRYVLGLIAAASVALLCFFLFPDHNTFIKNQSSDNLLTTLPAKSSIEILPTSSIEYNEENWNKERHISLMGNATFKVTKGVPFIVSGNNGKVEVLGTQFDVLDADNRFQVKVIEGKVKTTSGNITEILTKDMSFLKNPKWAIDQTLDNKWVSDKMFFAFENQSLQSVMNALSLSKGISFNTTKIDINKNFTGYFNSEEPLETLLQTVFWPMNYSYTFENNIVIVDVKNNE